MVDDTFRYYQCLRHYTGGYLMSFVKGELLYIFEFDREYRLVKEFQRELSEEERAVDVGTKITSDNVQKEEVTGNDPEINTTQEP